jgi:hypothetical protein
VVYFDINGHEEWSTQLLELRSANKLPRKEGLI